MALPSKAGARTASYMVRLSLLAKLSHRDPRLRLSALYLYMQAGLRADTRRNHALYQGSLPSTSLKHIRRANSLNVRADVQARGWGAHAASPRCMYPKYVPGSEGSRMLMRSHA